MNKKTLLTEILEWYEVDSEYELDNMSHLTITKELKKWLPTLLQSNLTHLKEEGVDYYLWSKEEIEFIVSL